MRLDLKTQKAKFQDGMIRELMGIDKEGAQQLLRVWSEYMSISAAGMDMEFRTIEQYLPYRMKEAGIP